MQQSPAQLTPKELADAIGASESSVRRWVDAGDIHISRTAGGHRRILLADAIQFIRKIGATVVRPDLLGLGELSPANETLLGQPDEQKLFESLQAGDRGMVKGLLVSWYLGGKTLPAIFDGPVRAAFERLGELWKHDPRAILIEHRATEICIDATASVRGMLPAVDEDAPVAIGGSPHGDPYRLPTTMASIVLVEAGFREVNYGPNTPIELLWNDAVDRNARLVWLSLSSPQDPAPLRASVKKMAAILAGKKINLVLGGRHAAEVTPRGLRNVSLIGSMSELSAFARGVVSAKQTN